MVISANPPNLVPPPQVLEVNPLVTAPTVEQTGSFAPPTVSATTGLISNPQRVYDDLHDIAGWIRCGGNHREEVCQEKYPWEYIAPYYGSVDFGQGFFSIPMMDSDAQPIEQLNYAHIIVETGEVNVEHEFNVRADSMNINWRFFAKPVTATEFCIRFPNAKSIDELAHFGKLFMKMVPGAISRIAKWNGGGPRVPTYAKTKICQLSAPIDLARVSCFGRLHRQTPLSDLCLEIANRVGFGRAHLCFSLTVWF
jgi:hypothetical protein